MQNKLYRVSRQEIWESQFLVPASNSEEAINKLANNRKDSSIIDLKIKSKISDTNPDQWKVTKTKR